MPSIRPSRSADNATNRREAADFEVPSPAMTRQLPLGQPYGAPSLRVDTLISIRVHGPPAKLVLAWPPSRLASQLRGHRDCAPAGDAQQPCHHGSQSYPCPAPAITNAIPAAAMTRAGKLLRVSHNICSMAPIAAGRQKRSKELSTSCQAVSRLGMSASAEAWY